MNLVDANLLVYAHVREFSQHDQARTWLDRQLAGPTRVGLAWQSLTTFVRLVANPRVFSSPEPLGVAWSQVSAWLDAPAAWVPVPTDRHRDLLARCLQGGPLRADDVPDADLAALAMEHGLRVATTDRGFARFEGLAWFDPLRVMDEQEAPRQRPEPRAGL